ncbi:MAG: hypothetical protein RMK15_04060 [Chloroflexota bacterium]|nr:hypothetical protein [Dehalococcoidia bacterium]MDW8046438.1 hypothetical protein [Chloroflexota bacterium]
MHSSLIGKIEKARLYAQERDRVRFERLAVTFRGENDVHRVELADGEWRCSCDFFAGWGVCSHTMALEKILQGMVPPVQMPDAARATA